MVTRVIFPITSKDVDFLPFYVTGVGLDYEEGVVIREQGYQDYQWSYCLDGEGIFRIGGKSYVITKGMAFFFRKDVPHSYENVHGFWKTEWVTFNGREVESLFRYMDLADSSVIIVDKEQDVRQRLTQMFYTLSSQVHLHEKMLRSSSELYEFLIFMRETMGKNQNEGKDKEYERLGPVIHYMDTYYQRPITLEELAQQIGVTKYYLCRIFKETYGSKPFDYLTQVRLQKAKEYLVTCEEMKVKEIGEYVGFNDTSYFCLKFKEYEKCSPLEFRRRYSL
ncbi:MAG: AraC family transcriptional regulator [Cellulosilyticaceae bacterium]